MFERMSSGRRKVVKEIGVRSYGNFADSQLRGSYGASLLKRVTKSEIALNILVMGGTKYPFLIYVVIECRSLCSI